MVTVKKIEAQHLPEVDEAFAKSLGIADGTVEACAPTCARTSSAKSSSASWPATRPAVMDALVASGRARPAEVAASQARSSAWSRGARADLKQRGIKDADKAPIPAEMFRPQAERRVRLGLVVAELVRANNLQAKPEQLQAHIEEMAQSYEKPAEVVRWYCSDRRRLAEVEAIVVENNVTELRARQGQGRRQGSALRRADGELTPRLSERAGSRAVEARSCRPHNRAPISSGYRSQVHSREQNL